METVTSCERFDRFLKSSKPGNHMFRGNLFTCEPDTNGMIVTATEVECIHPGQVLNHVSIEKPSIISRLLSLRNETSGFKLNTKCF